MWHDVRGCWCYAPLQDKAGYYRTTRLSHPFRRLASAAVNHPSETAHLVSACPALSISAADQCCWKLTCSVYSFTSTTRKKALQAFRRIHPCMSGSVYQPLSAVMNYFTWLKGEKLQCHMFVFFLEKKKKNPCEPQRVQEVLKLQNKSSRQILACLFD